MLSLKDFLGHPAAFLSPALLSAERRGAWHCIARLARQTHMQIHAALMLLFVQSSVLADTFAGEYFLESDPGVSRGVAFTTDATGNLDLTIPTDVLSFGLHRIGFRVQDGAGNWSTNDFRHFLKLDAIIGQATAPVAAEYFFETDPGVGNGTAAALDASGTLLLDLPVTDLPFGLNRIGIRVQDAQGIWSTNDFRHFLKLDAIVGQATAPVAAEYFFDTDPGVGQGTEVTLDANGALLLNLPASQFSFGLNRIGIRVRDAQGIWSTNDFRHFLKIDDVDLSSLNQVSTIWWTIKNSSGALVKNGTWPANGSSSFLLARVLEVGDLPTGTSFQLEVGAADSLGRSGPLSIFAFMVPEGPAADDANANGIPDDATSENFTYNDWLTRFIHPAAPEDQAALLAGLFQDADGDGVLNIQEYHQGSDPLVANQEQPLLAALNPISEEEGAPSYLSINFTEVKAAAGNLKVIVECSTSLNGESTPWLPVQREPVVISENGDTRVIRYLDDEPVTSSNKRFMRLRLEELTE